MKWNLPAGFGARHEYSISFGIAAEMLPWGRSITAPRAYKIGFVNDVVPNERLMDECLEWAEYMRTLGQPSVRTHQQMLYRGRNMPSTHEAIQGGTTMADKTPAAILEEARKLIGSETPQVPGRYPVEYDAIRRYCYMCDDTNPLFLDPEYAKRTKYGDVISPPLLISYFAGNGIWPPAGEQPQLPPIPTPGDRAINLTTEYEFLKPVKVGDRLSTSSRIADVFIKGIRLDPEAFWTVTERIIRNQDGEVVCIARNTGLRHRTPEQVKAAAAI
jgi:acyl dehydratase